MKSALMFELFGLIENQLDDGVDIERIFAAFKWCVENERLFKQHFEDRKAGYLYEKLLNSVIDVDKPIKK